MKEHWQWNRRLGAVLLLVMLVPLGACSDSETNPKRVDESDTSSSQDPDVGSTQDVGGDTDLPRGGYHLRGQLVPSSGFSMGATYTLSGTLSAGAAPADLKGKSYRLTTTP